MNLPPLVTLALSRLETLLGRAAPRLLLAFRRRIGYGMEPELALVPRFCRADAVAVDIGANAGMYTYHMLKTAREVVAFEPNPRYSSRLRRSFPRRVQVHAVALSDHPGVAQLRIPCGINGAGTMHAGNHFGGSFQPADIETIEVPMQRLDDFALRDVSFIKIDVEGYELTLLAGAFATIALHQPALLIEIEERHAAGALAEVARRLGAVSYQGFFYEHGRLHALASFQQHVHQDVGNLGKRYINNFLFLRPEHLPRVHDLMQPGASNNLDFGQGKDKLAAAR